MSWKQASCQSDYESGEHACMSVCVCVCMCEYSLEHFLCLVQSVRSHNFNVTTVAASPWLGSATERMTATMGQTKTTVVSRPIPSVCMHFSFDIRFSFISFILWKAVLYDKNACGCEENKMAVVTSAGFLGEEKNQWPRSGTSGTGVMMKPVSGSIRLSVMLWRPAFEAWGRTQGALDGRPWYHAPPSGFVLCHPRVKVRFPWQSLGIRPSWLAPSAHSWKLARMC